MLKRELVWTDIFWIAVNLVPLLGILLGGWDTKEMFIVYCLESLILGFFNVIKMFIVTCIKGSELSEVSGRMVKVHGAFFMLFFICTYGMLMFITTSIFTAISNFNDALVYEPVTFFIMLPGLLSANGTLVLCIFIAGYGVHMLSDFIFSGKYKTTTLNTLLFQPFGRAIVQQVIVAAGCMFLKYGNGKLFIIVFVAIKVGFELYVSIEGYLNPAKVEWLEGEESDS